MNNYKLINFAFNWESGVTISIPYSGFVSVCVGIAILGIGLLLIGKAIACVVQGWKGTAIKHTPQKFYETWVFKGCAFIATSALVLHVIAPRGFYLS